MTPDVNVLVAAFRDEHVHHQVAHAWLMGALEDCSRGGSVEILPMVGVGFVRLVTNPKVFPLPVSADAAHGFIRSILSVAGASMPRLGGEWGAFEKLCVDLKLHGNDVPDGWIAATVRANGLTLVTFDIDFADLLGPSECLLLQSRPGIQERRASYALRRLVRKRAT